SPRRRSYARHSISLNTPSAAALNTSNHPSHRRRGKLEGKLARPLVESPAPRQIVSVAGCRYLISFKPSPRTALRTLGEGARPLAACALGASAPLPRRHWLRIARP